MGKKSCIRYPLQSKTRGMKLTFILGYASVYAIVQVNEVVPCIMRRQSSIDELSLSLSSLAESCQQLKVFSRRSTDE